MTDPIQKLLWQYELADKELRTLREKHAALFEKIERCESAKEQAKADLKRLLYTKDGPPDVVPIGKKSHVYAVGELFQVVVTYKKHSDYFEPTKLPKAVLTLPGIVATVDTAACQAYAEKDRRVKHALMPGGWMTPSLTVSRRE